MNLEVEGSKISGPIMFDRGSFGWMVISVYQADYCTPQDADECILCTLTHHTRHSIKKPGCILAPRLSILSVINSDYFILVEILLCE
jgi:hypothetical protein